MQARLQPQTLAISTLLRQYHKSLLASSTQIPLDTSTPSAAADSAQVGAAYRLSKAFTQQDITTFVTLTGDTNPIHTDPKSAREQSFKATILPGLLSASLFPAIIGSQFPGAVYLKQELTFRNPAMVGETLIATVTVAQQSGDTRRGRRVYFDTVCEKIDSEKGDKAVVVDGRALAILPPNKQR